MPGLLLRDAADLTDQHLAVKIEECLKHVTLAAGADGLVGVQRRIRLRNSHAATVIAGSTRCFRLSRARPGSGSG